MFKPLLMVLALSFSAPLLATTPGHPLPFKPDVAKQVRVIISSDAKNEADDDFAVAHALLTPTFDVRGLIAAHYQRTAKMMKKFDPTEPKSYQELQHLTSLMHASTPVWHGAQHEINQQTQPLSEGAEGIIREALSNDTRPLFVLVLGPATDVALALQARPEIASRLTVVWIGGNPYPKGGWEYNLYNDPQAGRILFASKAPLWQVPHNVYMSMRVSLAKLAVKVKPQGKTGEYLWQQMLEFNDWASANLKGIPWPKSEVWVLGDNPAIALLLDDHEYHYTMVKAPKLNDDLTYSIDESHREIRVYNAIDARFVLEDFYAKLQLAYGQ